MCEVVELTGAACPAEAETAAPMRQPGNADPVSHFISLGEAVRKVVDQAEQHMNESAAAGCRKCE